MICYLHFKTEPYNTYSNQNLITTVIEIDFILNFILKLTETFTADRQCYMIKNKKQLCVRIC